MVLDRIEIVRYVSSESDNPILAVDFGDASSYDVGAMLEFARASRLMMDMGMGPQ